MKKTEEKMIMLEELEIAMGKDDDIKDVQNMIHQISLKLKHNKDKNLQNRFNNLLLYFRIHYLFRDEQ